MSKLISPDRCVLSNDYYTRPWRDLYHAGVIVVSGTDPTKWKHYDEKYQNTRVHFEYIAISGLVDDVECRVIPIKLNKVPNLYTFDSEDWTKAKEINEEKPAQIFFLGSDDSHFAMRFSSFLERDLSLDAWGEELFLLSDQVIFHN